MANRLAKVVMTLDGKRVEVGLDKIREKTKQLKNEMNNLAMDGKQNTKAFKDRQKAVEKFHKAEEDIADVTKRINTYMKDLGNVATTDLRRAYREGIQLRDGFKGTDKELQKLNHDLAAMQAQINKNTGATAAMTSAQKGFSSAIASTAKNLATYMIGFAGFNKVKSLVEDVFRSNLKLSDSLANIRKVSGLSSEAINELYRNISKIDSRNTIETLNQLAYTGAKLGIGQNYGVEGLTGFVKAAEQVQMALGEDMGEKALPDLSKMVEVMGLIPKYGVEQSMQKAASAIFQLGATSTATGTNIVEFSKRLYGLANVSRISTQDLLALGSASDAMGLMPEVSATAFNKLFTSIQRQHNLIEQSLGMTKGTIKQYYDEGKTMDAIVEIFERMNQKGNLNLLGSIFKDLGSDGARLVNVMATMADRADILRKHLETSRNAFQEGEAVIGEYMIQNQTAAALVERSANLWAKAFVNPEGVDMVKEMAQAWYDLSKSMTQSDAMMGSLHSSLNMIAGSIRLLIEMFPALIRFALIFGGAFGFKGLIAGIGGLIAAFRTLYTDIALATGAMSKLNLVMKSNAILFVASAIATAISLVYDYSQAVDEAAERERKRQEELKAAFESSKEAVQNVIKPLERYKRILEDGNLTEKQKSQIIKDLNREYQEYLDYLGIEIKSAADLAKAYGKVVEIMKIKKAYEERESFRQQKNGDNRMTRIENQAKTEAAARSFGLTGVDKKFLEANQHLGTAELYRKLVEQKVGAKSVKVSGDDVSFLYVNDKLTNAGTQFSPRAKVRYKKVGSEELYNAINDYIGSYRAERSTNRQIDAEFDSEYTWTDKNGKKRKLSEFNIDEYNDTVQKAVYKRKGSLDNEKPDKDAIRAARQAENEEKKRMRGEKEDAEKSTRAVIGSIEEFYRLQEAAANELAANGQLKGADFDLLVKHIQDRKDKMLLEARRAIVGDKNTWDDIKQSLSDDLIDRDSEVSQQAIKRIQEADPAKKGAVLRKYDGSDAVYGLDSNAWLNDIRKNAAQNELNIQRRQAAVQAEIDKILLQYQFVEQAQRDFGDNLVKMGLVTDGYQKVVKQLADGTEIVANTNEVQGFANKVVGLGSQLYGVNPESTDQLKQLMQSVMTTNGKDKESFAAIFPNFDKWMKQPEKYKEQMQAMYELMIQYEGIYYDKLKQRDDLQNKRLGSWWDHSDEKKKNDKKLRDIQLYDFQYNTMHEGETMGFMMGLTNDVSQDPEVMHEQAILEAKIDIWQKAKEGREAELISEEEYQQKLRDMQDQTMVYTEKVMQNINKRIDRIKNFVKPVETAAKSIGQKLGDMIFNMESEEATWEEIWKNMALAVAESMLTMAGQYAQNAIVKASMNRAEETEEGAHATVMTLFGISEGAAKTIGTLGWIGIALIPVITSLLMGLLTSALSSSNKGTTKAASKNTKLASGMLTYDKGNVDSVSAGLPSGKRRYLGQDGKVYTATAEPAPEDGLVTHPIATTVQGQPALVAENGPEIVIGRETTKAIMMNEPDLIRYLATYHKHGGFTKGLRPFDEGNVDTALRNNDISEYRDNGNDTAAMTADDARALTAALTAFVEQCQRPLRADINMYGNNGLYENMQKANRFMSRYRG